MDEHVLARHARLQEAFHPGGLPEPGSARWASYVEYNALSVVKELGEALEEVEVRPWKSPTGVVLDREAFIGELVDVWFFTANLLLAVGCSDAELRAAWEAKLDENLARLRTGRSVPIAVSSPDQSGTEA